MQILFLSAAIVLGYQITYLFGPGLQLGELRYMLINGLMLGVILFIFKVHLHETRLFAFVTKHSDALIRLGIIALLQALVVLTVLLIRSV